MGPTLWNQHVRETSTGCQNRCAQSPRQHPNLWTFGDSNPAAQPNTHSAHQPIHRRKQPSVIQEGSLGRNSDALSCGTLVRFFGLLLLFDDPWNLYGAEQQRTHEGNVYLNCTVDVTYHGTHITIGSTTYTSVGKRHSTDGQTFANSFLPSQVCPMTKPIWRSGFDLSRRPKDKRSADKPSPPSPKYLEIIEADLELFCQGRR